MSFACRTGLCVLAVLLARFAFAQSPYPSKPIRLVVASSAGSGIDLISRLVAPSVSQRLGQQVVVDNRAGAGTMIGGEIVAKSAPDGFTLLASVSTLAINPAMYKKLPYDALRDFAPITQMASLPNVLVVHPSLPAKSVKELIALAKAKPGQIVFGSAGNGTSPHLSIELLLSMTGTRMLHVPYKGPTPALIDLLGGRVSVVASSSSGVVNHVRSGRLRALGVTTAKRTSALPEIPTIAEAGVPGYESTQWHALLAPAGTPDEIIARLHKEFTAVLLSAEVKERVAAEGSEIVAGTPAELAAYLRSETAKWAKVIKSAGIEPE